ncbi:unnamed protein product [Brachionus calyciflorus]|uniref:Uncharacterized protein n=1 Tax=Brachionus calyciflorus TaxID=104777 RepID=A0A813MV42_9BILA|nr:unnamed protein product [Brachionus calyciflorus]
MFNKFKKKLNEIKNDLNHKIDQLEVDKNHILNKIQRNIKPEITSNGITYSNRKDQTLIEIQNLSRKIEEDTQFFEKQVKEVALVHTTNLFYTVRTIEKEIQSIIKSIESTRSNIENFQDFCLLLNKEFTLMENLYEELDLCKKIDQFNKDKIKSENLDDELLEFEEKIELSDKLRLSFHPEDKI